MHCADVLFRDQQDCAPHGVDSKGLAVEDDYLRSYPKNGEPQRARVRARFTAPALKGKVSRTQYGRSWHTTDSSSRSAAYRIDASVHIVKHERHSWLAYR